MTDDIPAPTDPDFWARQVQSLAHADQVISAMQPYAVRVAIRAEPVPGKELHFEQVRDRLLECLAYRLHGIFQKTWDPQEDSALQSKELPMLTGAGARIVSLADVFHQGWPTRRMTPFHENTKAGMMLGHVDLELAACWVLRERLGLTDEKSKLSILFDPSRLDLMLDQLVMPEHTARAQAFSLQDAITNSQPDNGAPRVRRGL